MTRRWKVPVMIGVFLLLTMYCVFGNSLRRYTRPVGLKDSVAEYREGIETMEVLTAKVGKGPEVLRDWIAQNEVEAPLIHSKWYVDLWEAEYPGWARFERAKRGFGRALLERLEETAREIQEMKDAHSREKTAIILFDLAEWLRKAPGYGNVLLYYRLQDLAAVCLGYLTADLSLPDERLRALVERLGDPVVDVDRWELEVLNLEAPGPVFWYGGKQVRLYLPELQWNTGHHRGERWAQEHGIGRMLKAPKGARTKEFWDYTGSDRELREKLPRELAFYFDDGWPRPWTTLTVWDLKLHKRLTLGWWSVNIRHVKAFFAYRTTVGAFPTEVPSGWKPRHDSIEPPELQGLIEAFKTPFPRSSVPPVPTSTAAQVYYEVLHNKFLDADGRRVRLWREHQRWLEQHGMKHGTRAAARHQSGRSERRQRR